jgi:hypothetical protein
MMTTIKKIQKLGVFILALFFCGSMVMAQTTIGHIGGRESNAVYNFLNLPHSAKASSLGGINISRIQSDIGLAMYNPALLTPTMDSWLHLSVKPYLADIKQYDFSGANYLENKNIVVK